MILLLMSNVARQFNSKSTLKTRLCLVFWGALPFSLSPAFADSTPRCLPNLIAPLQLEAKFFTKESMAIPLDVEQSVKNLTANQLTQPSPSQYLFKGDAKFSQPGLVVLSDQMLFDKTRKEATFTGNVELHQPEIILTANQIELNQKTQSSTLTNARYQVLPSRVHGHAKKIQLEQRHSTAQLYSANLTACQKQPNKNLTWALRFKEVEINQKTEKVAGYHTSLWIKGVPVLYTPYFAYSLADRASGFLFAEFGSLKSVTQKEHLQFVKIPYFFNIAPNIDDTLTIIPMDKRGLIFNNEFRYMTKNDTVQHRLTLDTSYLQDLLTAKEGLVSTTSDRNKEIEHRWRASLKANQNWGDGLNSSVVWHETSDENFYADIPVESRLQTVTQIPRNLTLTYQKDNLKTYAKISSYLRLRNAPLNYEKHPEIGLSYRQKVQNVNMSVQASTTNFVLPIDTHTRPEALRFTVKPSIDYQINKPYGALKATLTANHIQYQMKDNANNNTGGKTHSLFVPQFALKGGLVFERPIQFFGQSYTQTLEPETQYLYVPHQNQSKLPLFDTGNRSLAFSNLFALNRFTGSDRIGDANQITTALTTRFLDANGRRIADAGIGQIFYLDNRQVGLKSEPPKTNKSSDVFLKVGLNIGALNIATTVQLTQQDYQLLHANSRLKYRSQRYGTLLANHVLSNKSLPTEKESLSIGGYTQVTQNWQLGMYVNYDLYTKQLFHGTLGLRYDGCCWATEFMTERTQLENGLYNDQFRVQFELKGLSTSDQTFRKSLFKQLNF